MWIVLFEVLDGENIPEAQVARDVMNGTLTRNETALRVEASEHAEGRMRHDDLFRRYRQSKDI